MSTLLLALTYRQWRSWPRTDAVANIAVAASTVYAARVAPASCTSSVERLGIGARGHTAARSRSAPRCWGCAVDHWVGVLQRCRHRVAVAMCIAGADAAINGCSSCRPSPLSARLTSVLLTTAGCSSDWCWRCWGWSGWAGRHRRRWRWRCSSGRSASQRVGADAGAVDDRALLLMITEPLRSALPP